ncbi:hypothetical protein GCM10008983_18090 [Lentibacillus halophilus]|uniref:histidine kinase n=2 Tax=Lentibacillus halophilus TaxID=295065 RepID=A0ABN0ZAC0_9BACI
MTMVTVGIVAVAIAAFLSTMAIILVTVLTLLLIGTTLWATMWRYREIGKLSGYLRDISSGNYSMDVRDNEEGELSILKNEIYKVTSMLAEHKSSLQADKTHLTDAISDISHQLKTPLTSMRVMTDLLEDPNLPESKRIEFTHNIHVQLERLDWLVTSLLKLSKIDAGTVQFKQDVILVRDLIEKALESLHAPIDVKNQRVSIQGEDTVSFTGDLNWTAEALVNILKNGIEHTPEEGSMSIRFSENTLFTDIVITDNGPGIPKEDLPYIFNRFHKGKHNSEESVGIGLAMAHGIIANQGGTIDVDSAEGQGTQFHVKFYKHNI